jgi:nanoRNase/pAp phosphatase (c-di-AMP/oligoRNAs hydrolase)
MRYVLVSGDDFLWRLVPPTALPGESAVYLVEGPTLRDRIRHAGASALAGKLTSPNVYRRAFRSGSEPAVVAVPPERQADVVGAIRSVAPAAPIVILSDERGDLDFAGLATVAPSLFAGRVLVPEVERAATRARVDRIRAHFDGPARVLIMLQDDPDPDAIASALALRALLGRNPRTAPIATFGSIRRPENRAMTRILEIDVAELAARAVAQYDMIAMVDVQPSFFKERSFSAVDLVIDHHPEDTPVRAVLKDIRPSYGATSTILTEYLRSADTKLTQRLATALLYGIKADTQDLERGTTRADVEAFAFLHGHANHGALRRIERPALPPEAIELLAEGLRRRQVADGVVFSHVGRVAYPELVPQFADLFLQIQGTDWSVVSGTVDDELHVSVRNVGYVRAAGEVVRHAFGDLGSAGGHRSMAKAVVRLTDWRARVGPSSDRALGEAIVSRFQRALRSGS